MFRQLALSRTQVISEMLHDIGVKELEGLTQFYASSADITPAEFMQFTRYLTKNTSVSAWEWIPAVPASRKTAFEQNARQDGLEIFEIWQKDSHGKRIPASGRPFYYPVFRVAPLGGNEKVLGYDLGSESVRRAAIENAKKTGLPCATEDIPLMQETGSQKEIFIFKPVFDYKTSTELRGFTLAVIRMTTLIESDKDNSGALLEISSLHKNAPREVLASMIEQNISPEEKLSLIRPVFAFGKVYSVTAYAGPHFMEQYPVQAVWVAIVYPVPARQYDHPPPGGTRASG